MSQERTVGQRPAVRGLAVRWAHLKFGLDVDGRANVSSSVLCMHLYEVEMAHPLPARASCSCVASLKAKTVCQLVWGTCAISSA